MSARLRRFVCRLVGHRWHPDGVSIVRELIHADSFVCGCCGEAGQRALTYSRVEKYGDGCVAYFGPMTDTGIIPSGARVP